MNITLFMTLGTSLKKWDDWGIIDRELLLYRDHHGAGVGVNLISFGGPEDKAVASRFDFLNLYCRPGWMHPRIYSAALPWLHAQAFRNSDILKTNQAYGAHLALRCADVWQRPCVVRMGYSYAQNKARELGQNHAKAKAARQYEAQYFPKADGLIFTTDDIQSDCYEAYDISQLPCSVVPNYVDTALWGARSARDDLKIFHADREAQPFVATFVGRLSPEKNVDLLIQSAQGLNIKLNLIGHGPERDRLEALAQDYGVNCQFWGKQSQLKIKAILDQSDLFVLPSQYEGMPKVLIEAMAAGMFCLGTDVIGINTLIEHQQTGWLAPTSLEGLSQALITIMALPVEHRSNIAQRAQRSAKSAFGLEAVAARERNFLQSIL